MDSSEIAERIWLAIAQGRLAPGARLKEEELAESFEVGRARIRSVLLQLSREGLVDIIPNKGAQVAAPGVQEARDVFYLRSTVETRVAAQLTGQLTPQAADDLRDIVRREREAIADGHLADVIRLSGLFHLKLAELTGSSVLQSILRDLISRSSLITAVYRDTGYFNCGPDEHDAIVEALMGGNEDEVLRLVSEHIEHLRADLNLTSEQQPVKNLRDIFEL
ncbi:GntR family transcriptional regulator [Thalassorhabdomicrobium marinisediminis]|uniref:GntR family transcriptional regulator n=1 Tax=Thalassorhabdomicrobium marinisediminis TaxID=2170577 RepID=A0A2T7FTK9_9RHOB|nr:GntR family transcriptional regulator [Thalassorhabdomicrobium marinisediminis]PVA05507.1 GntR family transcriptional regulator [Thalassorhabdomicrobium marinisediminis]